MTGIRFMDEITAPRRSLHPSQLRPRGRPSLGGDEEHIEIRLSEYFVGMALDVPQLELFSRVAWDLQAWCERGKKSFLEAEEEAAKVTPELFREYAMADEEGQNELLVR